jgi:NAD(P)-dependent dehydrogenase (short-subunit alcohol dehydrogenase family)
LAHCGAAKAGVAQLMRGMALELAPFGIRVNAVAPGSVVHVSNRERFESPAMIEHHRNMILLGRPRLSPEIADAALYLASDESTFAIGGTITLDGGDPVH